MARLAATKSPKADLVRLPGNHYAPFLDAHEPAVEAELAFLRQHLQPHATPTPPPLTQSA